MKRVAVLTTFVHLWEAFSLCTVVEAHVRMLLKNGYDTTFVGCDGFQPRGVFANPLLRQWRMPGCHLQSDREAVERPADFRRAVERIAAALRPLIGQVDVAITHDLVYLPHHLAYNQACRELAREFPDVAWLHCIHSAPEPHQCLADDDPRGARFKPFPNAFLVYPNAYDVPRVAAQYAIPESDVRVVPHPLDWEEAFAFHPLTRALIERYDLYAPDILAIYPIRMDRGKQPEKLVRLFAELKRAGMTARLLIVNFHSTGEHFLAYRDEISREMRDLGLTSEDVIFTNQIDALPGITAQEMQAYRLEVPHKVVLDLFHLTNLYVHPSGSETYSLVCQEAAACGNLLVLNDDFPAMRDVYGPDAHYLKFSSTLFTTTHRPSEQAYYAGAARTIIGLLNADKCVHQKTRIRQTRNLQAVFSQRLEPLLHLQPASEARVPAAACVPA
jgi:glycosyltransferase involved in cell wall biosynthesis